MNQILSDPGDDTKGFFDPNTQENLTYLQLLDRSSEQHGLSTQVPAGTDCIAGVFVQSAKQTMSIYEAKSKGLLTPGTSLVLLEAQAATGFIIDPLRNAKLSVEEAVDQGVVGLELKNKLLSAEKAVTGYTDPHTETPFHCIIDPVHSHRVPVEVAYKRGYFDEEMNQILSDPGDDTKGFFDPNTQENLTYLQLLDRCVKDPQTGLRLLVVVKKEREETRSGSAIKDWHYNNRKCFLEHVLTTVHKKTSSVTVTTTTTTTNQPTFRESKASFSSNLFESQIIDKTLFEDLSTGKVTADQVSNMDSVRKYLQGTDCIAGVFVQSAKQTMSIYEAKSKGLLTPGTSLVLLEAQAATGFIIDPLRNAKLSVEEAVDQGVVGLELKNKLLSAEKAVTGYTDPHTGDTISLFQALKKDLIVKDHGIRLLEAQIATGGIIDPVHSHRVPVEVAYKRGYFDEEMNQILSDPGDDTKGFFDPNTQENLTYLQLLDRCVKDPQTGLRLLVVVKKEKEKKRDLVQQLKTGTITIECFLEHVLTTVHKKTSSVTVTTTTTTTKQPTFRESKASFSSNLFESQIIDKTLFEDLSTGKVTADQVSNMDSVRKYLQGTDCIAGVFVQSAKQTMSIYEAKSKGLLTPGTSLVLLEAQAATGFIIDPLRNAKLSVEEAVDQGVVGLELKNKLLSAEKAVTGYTDPHTGDTISLFQALKKDLIVKDHGIRLLEAQIATGGIIDPVHSHRVPVEVAYKRGYFDEEMNQILSDPGDDTKGFFDPNTQENLTYLQLLDRCVKDPQTGLRLLVVVKKESFTSTLMNKQRESSNPLPQIKQGENSKERSFSSNLFESQIIDKTLFEDLSTGKVTADQVSNMDSVRKYLQGTDCIAGVFVQSAKQTMSIYEAKSKGLLTPGTSLVLLEAQAATGFIIDPLRNAKLSVEEAVDQGVVGLELKNKLLSAEKAVTGYTDPHTGDTISLFQALKKDLIVKDHGIRLLEAQIATGGIIDPVHSHRVPVEVAYKRGYFDEEMNQILSDPGDDTKGFFDPNTQENLTYLQLLDRCVKDPQTGLRLLVVVKKEREFYFYIDEQTKRILQSTTTNKAGGKFQGKEVSLWDLINSDYIKRRRKRDLVQQLKTGTITIECFLEHVLTTVHKKTSSVTVTTTTTTTNQPTFRESKASFSSNLFESQIIDKTLFEDLSTGKVTADQVSNMDSVRKYLQGTDCIAGVFVQSAKQTMSIYEAKSKGLLTPGTSLVLLEAQAATGFIIDPLRNAKLSVEEAVDQGVVGLELKNKLLSAEKAVTGYTDPHTGDTISLFQALKKDLIVKDHGIRLLEAQIATGGIIDPVHSHRVPVEVAYKRGYFDEEMNQILSDPGDDTKGFFDPNTQENLTYLQLLDRCVKDPQTGLRLLVVVKKESFTSTLMNKQRESSNPLPQIKQGENSKERRKRDLVQQLKTGTITIECFLEHVLTTVHKKTSSVTVTTTTTTTNQPTFRESKASFSSNLFESQIIDKTLFEDLSTGKVTADQVSNMDSSAKQTMSIYEAKSKGLLTPGASLVLLEAQAATGFIIDPLRNAKLSVEEAVDQGVGARAEKQATFCGEGYTISLFQALKKDLIVKDHGIRLLEAQIATGGIIDPVHSHRVPVEVAYKRGYFDEEMNQILSDPGDDTKGFFDPNTQENLTYLQLLDRCVKDPQTGLRLLVVRILQSTTTNKAGGKFQGKEVSLWDLINSDYIEEEKKRDLVQQLKTGTITIECFLEHVLTTVHKKTSSVTVTTTTTTTKQPTFRESKASFSSNLFESQIIDKTLFEDLSTGKVTADQVSNMDSVRKYLQGTDCIAGVFVQSAKQTMSIYEAKSKGLLTPGTSLEAVDQGVVGLELKNKLLSAEKAVTGYTDPHTGDTISLFQALKKDLIVKDHGIRLLEAQIATGGIIDPVHSHRVPVEVAYKRGYFDEEMNQILSDPGDDTKGFFDPNTQENLTYLQLLDRCVKDPQTGLRLLVVVKKESFTSTLMNKQRESSNPLPQIKQGENSKERRFPCGIS
ncbi:hypothetical protein HF521_011702 [Silurus meridionalis]|uniref:Epiplakin n=1 Tax=Silurus meridionalis TaxID=175797 RepID=A0A8T0AGL2_SILME|nr:hypothetical protein HF521_011702 [Silurus meridionalis]